MNANNEGFKNSNYEQVQYKLDDNGTITSLMIDGNDIIEQYADQGFDVRISLFDDNVIIDVYHVDDNKDVLANDFTTLENLTTQKFAELVKRAKIEKENKDQDDRNLQMAADLNQKDLLLKDFQPLINRDTFAVRGDGRRFITAALYQYCNANLKKLGLDDASVEDSLQAMGFYSPYNPQSSAVQEIEDYYKRFFKDKPPSKDNHREAPDVDLMKKYLEKELGIGIKVEYYGKSDDIIIRNSEYDEQPVNQNEIITVALLSHDRHVVLPQTIDNMKERDIFIEEVQNQEEIELLGGVKLWLNQVQDLNNQSQFGSQQRLNGDEEEENIFDRFAREHENNLNNEGGIRPEDVRIAINAEDLGDVGGAYANGDGNQIEEEHSSSLGDVGGSANPTNPNILAEIPQLLRVNSLGARSQMQQSVINPPQNRENRSFLAKLCSCITLNR